MSPAQGTSSFALWMDLTNQVAEASSWDGLWLIIYPKYKKQHSVLTL